MDRPPELFDREREWSALVDFTTQRGAGIRLGLVRGRRRQGKSFLLRRLTEAYGGLYYQALDQERAQALVDFGRAVGRHLGVPGGRIAFTDWDEAFRAVAELRVDGKPALVVIDEFPYLLAHSPEVASVVQRVVDVSRDVGPPVRVIVCGSALSVMADLLVGSQALRGRASHDVVVGSFDYRQAATFWEVERVDVAVQVHAVLGGTPGYRDLLPIPPPRRLADLAHWLESGVCNPASAMFREDDYLLTEERTLTDRALYHAVVGAIAAGNTSQGAIAAAIGRESRAVQHPLRALAEAGFVVRDDDVLRQRRPIYRIADPIVRFHHVVTRPDLARFEDRRFADAWADAAPRFRSQVLGPHFEQLARDFTFAHAAPATVGGRVARVGSAVVNDARGRSQHQVDVVATVRHRDGSTAVSAIGEAKHTTGLVGHGELARLERIRLLLAARGQAPATTRLLLFSGSGFARPLVEVARARRDVELIDLDRLYHGE